MAFSKETYAILKKKINDLDAQTYIGSVNSLTAGNEQAELNAFDPSPSNGDMVANLGDNTVWMYSEAKGEWGVYKKNEPLDDATTTRKGVVVVGDGIKVSNGKISTNKEAIGLDKVDNIRQYSVDNPAPTTVTFDGVRYTDKDNNPGNGVYITSDAVKTVNQVLSVEQKAQARKNIGAGSSSSRSNWEENDPDSEEYIKNKPAILTKQSELDNDDYTVKDSNYNNRVFTTVTQKNETLTQINTNKNDIADLNLELDDTQDDLAAETLRAKTQENSLQTQINLLKGKTQILGGTDCPVGQEQAVLTTFAQNVTGDTVNRPQEGDLINVMSDGNGGSRNEQWQWIVIRDTSDQIVSQEWKMVSGPPIVVTATETELGVAKYPSGGGLNIDTAGNVTVNKHDIELDKVDNVRQYSVQNPAPVTVKIDGVAFSGNTKDGVEVTTGAVLYDRGQTLTDAQKYTARTNLGITSGAKPDWNAATNTDAGILNKPEIPTKTSQLENDMHFVADAHYVHTDNNYSQAAIDNMAANTQNIETLKSRATTDETNLATEIINRTNADKTLQEQIDQLKGTPGFVGSISTMTSVSDLTAFVVTKTGKVPVKGQMVSVLDTNRIYYYTGSEWEVYLSSNLSDATTEDKGVVQIGTGLRVSNGVVSATKETIGLDKVDNVRQYSADNPVPIDITLDGTTRSGTSAAGVTINTDYVRFSVDQSQTLTEPQKQIARKNIGIDDEFLTNSDWEAAYGTKGYIKNKPYIPENQSDLVNNDYTVKDVNYENRVFASLTQRENFKNQVEQNKADIKDIQDEQVEQNNEITKLKRKSYWVGSIRKFEKDSPTADEKKADLNAYVLEKMGTAPAEGYQVSVLDESAVYQYSAVSDTWEVFVENQTIQFATKTDAGVVKIGDGLKIDESGLLSSEAAGGDWGINDQSEPGYIKNRTHFEGAVSIESFESGLDWTNLDQYVHTNIIEIDDGRKYCCVMIGDAEAASRCTSDNFLGKANNYIITVNKSASGDITKTKITANNMGNWSASDATKCEVFSHGNTARVYSIHEDGIKSSEMVFPKAGLYSFVIQRADGSFEIEAQTIYFESEGYVKKLDEKYLPDTLATKSWVLSQTDTDGAQSDWKEADPTDSAFIKNRPFGDYPILNARFTGDKFVDKSGYVFTDAGRNFWWVGDDFYDDAVIQENVSTIIFMTNEDNEKTFEGATSVYNTNATRTRYVCDDGTSTYHFAIVPKKTNSVERGVYFSPNNKKWLTRVYSPVTYAKYMMTLNGAGTNEPDIYAPTAASNSKNMIMLGQGSGADPTYMYLNGGGSATVDFSNSGIYAPTDAGSTGYYLIGQGAGYAPTWFRPLCGIFNYSKYGDYGGSNGQNWYARPGSYTTYWRMGTQNERLVGDGRGVWLPAGVYYVTARNYWAYIKTGAHDRQFGIATATSAYTGTSTDKLSNWGASNQFYTAINPQSSVGYYTNDCISGLVAQTSGFYIFPWIRGISGELGSAVSGQSLTIVQICRY